jgi:hypothetical protein
VVNPGEGPISVTLEFYNQAGALVAQVSPPELTPLAARNKVARFLSELAAPTGFRGTVVVRAVGGTIAATGLSLKEGVLTALPVVPTR